MIVDTETIIDIYEFLREYISKEASRAIVSKHAHRGQLVYMKNSDNRVSAVAVYLQVDDPFDVTQSIPLFIPSNGLTERADGKYVYLPFILIHRDYRSVKMLREMLGKCSTRCIGATRVAFRRVMAPRRKKKFGLRHRDRIHVLEMSHGKTRRGECTAP